MSESFTLHNVSLVNNKRKDITIENNKIKTVTESGESIDGRVIDCSDMYVSSGWIDLHVHAFKDFQPYGDDIDEIGVNLGVTTVVDAGSCGADQINQLIERGKESKTNLFAFLNASKIGLKRIDELSNLSWIDEKKIINAINDHPNDIVGLKVRMSNSVIGGNGLKPLLIAREIADKVKLPIMVHVGSSPPDITEIVSNLRKGDVITHFLNGKANKLFSPDGKPYPEVAKAIDRGVHLDVGHGTASFSFETAKMAKENHIHFDTISTDIYRNNRKNGPVYSMAHTLSKFLHLGYPLQEIIDGVTINAAKWLNQPALGRIKEGDLAHLTLFSIEDKLTQLIDSDGQVEQAKQVITAKGVVINGEVIIY